MEASNRICHFERRIWKFGMVGMVGWECFSVFVLIIPKPKVKKVQNMMAWTLRMVWRHEKSTLEEIKEESYEEKKGKVTKKLDKKVTEEES